MFILILYARFCRLLLLLAVLGFVGAAGLLAWRRRAWPSWSASSSPGGGCAAGKALVRSL